MENPNLDETRPVSPQQEAEDNPEPPINPVDQSSIFNGETLPYQVEEPIDANQATLPTPVSQDAPDSEMATMPVSLSSPASGGDTPLSTAGQDGEGSEASPKRSRSSWRMLTALAILSLFLIAALSAFGGYRSGINQRNGLEATQIAQVLQTQFPLGVQDLDTGRYALAQQRFEYVIKLDPNYPGAVEKLSEVLLKLRTTATPTPAPTPTPTFTPLPPDFSGVEALMNRARELLAGGDWSGAIDVLLTIRKKDPTYQTVQVDGMLYISLRNRGVDKISKQHDLEGGTYDLALAERFGPLDVEAQNWRDWATMYVRGARFWGVDWAKVVDAFKLLNDMAPGITDGSGWSAAYRYRIALVKYGDWLAAKGDWCNAQQQYQAALDLSPNPTVVPTATFAADRCSTPTQPPTATPLPTTSETPSGATPTTPVEATPTPTSATPSPTPQPSASPTPTVPTATPYPPPTA